MIKINLLPFRIARSRENIRRQISIFLLLIIFICLVLLFFYLNNASRIRDLKAQVASIELDMAKYKKIGDEIQEIQNKLELLKKKMAVIDQLETNRYEPVRLLVTISDAVVRDRMWIDSLSDQGAMVKISGVAMDEKTVADFMTRLEKSGRFAAVGLGTLKKKTFKDNIDLKVFELLCSKMNAPIPAAEQAVKK
jgi:type IV pilus assembly protein PilN